MTKGLVTFHNLLLALFASGSASQSQPWRLLLVCLAFALAMPGCAAAAAAALSHTARSPILWYQLQVERKKGRRYSRCDTYKRNSHSSYVVSLFYIAIIVLFFWGNVRILY